MTKRHGESHHNEEGYFWGYKVSEVWRLRSAPQERVGELRDTSNEGRGSGEGFAVALSKKHVTAMETPRRYAGFTNKASREG